MRALWVLAAVSVVAGVTWLVLARSDTASRPSAPDTAVDSAPARDYGDAPGLVGLPEQTLGGRVVRADGSPAPGVAVSALRRGDDEPAHTTTVEDGTFLFEGLPSGFYRVRAVVDDEAPKVTVESWVRAGSRDLRLVLAEPTRTLRVGVLSPDGKPVPAFDARLLRSTGYVDRPGQTDGSVAFRGKGWIGAILEIWGARDADGHGFGYAPVRIGPLTREQSDLEVRLYEGAVLEGTVLGPEGPLASAEITLGPRERWWETMNDDDLIHAGIASPLASLPQRLPYEGLKLKVRTDEAGRFRVAFLRPAVVHELDLAVPEGLHRFRRREVRAGDGPLELRIQRPVKVRVTVLDPDRVPVKGAHVSALRPGSNGFNSGVEARTNADGVAVLGGPSGRLHQWRPGLDPTRTYKLVVNANYEPGIVRDPRRSSPGRQRAEDRSPPFLAEKALDNWTPTDVTVQLERGHTVAGRVLDSNGTPVDDCHVGICTPVGFGVYTTVGDGHFVFRGVPPGTIYMGLDDGGDMGGIVDRQRESMWDASFGPRETYSPGSPPPVREWRTLEVSEDMTNLTFLLPATINAEVVLPPGTREAAGSDGYSTRQFDATSVRVIRRTKKGWEYFRTAGPGLRSLREDGSEPVKIEGLVPGERYAAWMTPLAGQYVYVEFPAEVGKVVLERKAGATIRGKILDRPTESSRIRINVWDDRQRWVRARTPDSEGRFQVGGLPESTWSVRAWCRAADDVVWLAESKVKTGEEVELRLSPQPEEQTKEK